MGTCGEMPFSFSCTSCAIKHPAGFYIDDNRRATSMTIYRTSTPKVLPPRQSTEYRDILAPCCIPFDHVHPLHCDHTLSCRMRTRTFACSRMVSMLLVPSYVHTPGGLSWTSAPASFQFRHFIPRSPGGTLCQTRFYALPPLEAGHTHAPSISARTHCLRPRQKYIVSIDAAVGSSRQREKRVPIQNGGQSTLALSPVAVDNSVIERREMLHRLECEKPVLCWRVARTVRGTTLLCATS